MYTLVFGWLAAAHAVEPDRTLTEKMDAADLVVVAEVTSQEPRWMSGNRGGIETVVWLAVGETLRGTPRDTVEVVLPHGRIGAHATGSSAAPELQLDGRYLLLLSLDAKDQWRVFSPTTAIRLDADKPEEVRHVD